MTEDARFKKDIFDRKKACLTKNIKPLKEFVKNKKLFLPKELKDKGGIYAFWWIGDNNEFTESIKNCCYELKGKLSEAKPINVVFRKEWIDSAKYKKNICLYVGKSTEIKSRIPKHLKLGTPDIWKTNSKDSGKKPNTVSQLRIGLERLFPEKKIFDLIDKIGVSWTVVDEYKNGINRFYLENYFIGNFFPLLNADIER